MNPNISKMISMLIIMIAVFFVFRFSLASYYFNNAEESFKQGVTLELQDQSRAYTNALEQVEYAIKLRPKHAKALDLKGEILYRQWWLKPDGQYFRDSQLLQEAKVFHEKALAVRKEWPFTMLQLTRIEAHKPFLDENFYLRFNQTYEFGRFETVIGLDLMKIGLLRWNELNNDAKTKVVELTNISVQQKRNSLKKIAKELVEVGLFDYMCLKIESSERKQQMCSINFELAS